mmetsp:Transcript_842/g.1566  ORF Transcript_842/g.1566 Transcript_842/m.1566 type:complete len:81 (+) Transcript_842:231-473(+)
MHGIVGRMYGVLLRLRIGVCVRVCTIVNACAKRVVQPPAGTSASARACAFALTCPHIDGGGHCKKAQSSSGWLDRGPHQQ